MQELPVGRRRLDLSIKLDALVALKSVKKLFTLKELSEALEIPQSVISRYVAGEVSPSRSTAVRVLKTLMSSSFARDYLSRALKGVGWDIKTLFTDPAFLTYVSLYFRSELLKSVAGSRLDLVIVCSEPSGFLASTLLPHIDVRIAYADLLKEKDLRKVKNVAVLAAYLTKESINELIKLSNSTGLKVVVIEALLIEDPEGVMEAFPEAVLIHMLP